MDILSINFFSLTAIVLCVYWLVPHKLQWVLLLTYSVVFYMMNASPHTFLFVLGTVIIIWGAVNLFDKVSERKKKAILITALLINIAMLVVFKYLNLFVHTFNIFGASFTEIKIIAPLAISFYMLQMISYLLNCYWGTSRAEKNPLKLLLFACYFPQMTSGPISDYNNLAPQFYEKHKFDYDRVTSGIRRIAFGLLKKLAVSNRLGIFVDCIYSNTEVFNNGWIWVASAVYAMQLYTDFSGCIDIVCGVSECFGITLAENFKAPFFSKTIQEFWQRWHITLGGWARDYIMNPILKTDFFMSLAEKCKAKFGKKTGKKIPSYIAMLVVWLAIGIWHGDSWKYIIGNGIWYWIIIVIGQLLNPGFKIIKEKFHIEDGNLVWKSFQIIRTYLFFTVGMLFFRASSFRNALYLIKTNLKFSFPNLLSLIHDYGIVENIKGKTGFVIMILSFFMMAVVDFKKYKGVDIQEKVKEMPFIVRWGIYTAMILFIIASLGVTAAPFAYAQF